MRLLFALLFAGLILWADVRGCACDPARPETMSNRECSLCREADKHPGEGQIFFLKDINPRKPNRWLALPRVHLRQGHALHELSRDLQTTLWKAAIAKAIELWGPDDWGLAYNGELHRTQCHTHIHIGKLLKGLSPGKFHDVDDPSQIRIAPDGTGLWVHPVNGKLRVHYGEGITETALLR